MIIVHLINEIWIKNIKFSISFLSGYFSTLNEKSGTTATMYTTLVQLVRERVYKFLSVDSLQVYTETQNTGK